MNCTSLSLLPISAKWRETIWLIRSKFWNSHCMWLFANLEVLCQLGKHNCHNLNQSPKKHHKLPKVVLYVKNVSSPNVDLVQYKAIKDTVEMYFTRNLLKTLWNTCRFSSQFICFKLFPINNMRIKLVIVEFSLMRFKYMNMFDQNQDS